MARREGAAYAAQRDLTLSFPAAFRHTPELPRAHIFTEIRGTQTFHRGSVSEKTRFSAGGSTGAARPKKRGTNGYWFPKRVLQSAIA
jgi:hypothetical protein